MNRRVQRTPEMVQRAEAMAHFYANGATLQEVGDVYGVTRERVRQILRASGVPVTRHSRMDPVRCMQVCRRAGSLTEACLELRKQKEAVIACLVSLGAYPAMLRLWTWRQQKSGHRVSDQWLLARMRHLAQQLGRTPTKGDLDKHGPSTASYQNHFGLLSNAQRLAGLTPRLPGRYSRAKR